MNEMILRDICETLKGIKGELASKNRKGCPFCCTSRINAIGYSDDPKVYYSCVKGHKWVEYTTIEIMEGGDNND